MKFENLYIECENLEQRDDVANFVKRSGYSYVDSAHGDSTVAIYDNGRFQYLSGSCKFSPSISYSQFMQKYGKSEMKQSIEKAMADLKMGREELSSALGMSRPYITKMLTRPQSEKTQAKVVKMIDELMQSGADVKHVPISACTEKSMLGAAINERDKAIKELNRSLEYKDQLLAKNVDDVKQLQGKVNCMKVELDGANERGMAMLNHKNSMVDKMQAEIDIAFNRANSYEKDNYNLTEQVKVLELKNKNINICYSIVCVILTALVVWGFYV